MISKSNYFAITLIVCIVLIMFQMTGVSESVLMSSGENIYGEEAADEGTAQAEKRQYNSSVRKLTEGEAFVGLVGDPQSACLSVGQEWCINQKRTYCRYTDLSAAAADAGGARFLLTDGTALGAQDAQALKTLAEQGRYVVVSGLPDLEAIPEDVARAAKMMVVSYPANPVCVAAPRSFYEKLVDFARTYNIIILHDNAYSEIIYDGREGLSFLSIPGAREVGVEYNSLSKTYNLTGARISFVLGNRQIVDKFRTLRSQIDYGIFLPVQAAAAAALNGPQDAVVRQREAYQARRDTLCGGLRSIGWNVPDSQGSMFVWAPIPAGYASSEAFCFALLEKTGVLCTPGSAFGANGEGHVRFALTKPVEQLREVIRAVRDGLV